MTVPEGCGGQLPDGWYRDKNTLVREVAFHGGYTAAGLAHGVPQNTLSKWRARHGIPKGIPGTKPPDGSAAVQPGDPVSETEMLRQRVTELERGMRGARAIEVAEERILARLEAAVATTRPRYRPGPVPKTRAKGERHEMALLFSDTHAGETVRADEVLGMNDYDWATMLARMGRIRDAVASFVDHRPYPVERLHVWMLGDMLSGDIHEELVATNELPTAEAAVQFAADTADWLDGFTEMFPQVRVAGVPGNHPRFSRKPAAKQAHNNADWLAYHMMRLRHQAHPRLTFDIAKGAYQLAMVCERWRVLLMHGDGIRTTMPGVPWGGVVRRITTLEQQFAKAKTPIDYVCLGHFHTVNTLDGVGVKTVINGSVKGLDEYSLKSFGSGRHASQVLLTFHPRRGLTDVSTIDLQDVEPADPMAAAA